MAAWIGQYWQEERSGLMEADEESSRRRMVELMLGPFIASKPAHHQLDVSEQPTTLELLPAAARSCPPVSDNMGCTHIELEPETPLPSGWEKCLNLKTGSLYYLNRTTGATSVSDPRKDASQYKVCNRGDMSSSPSSSELTVEASNEVTISNSNGKHQRSFDINEKPNSVNCSIDESDLDLNLSLNVGLCSSPKGIPPSRDVGVLTLLPLSPSKIKASTNANASSASSSSSSSSTSSPISASLAFSQTILSSKELSQHLGPQEMGSFFKQESNQPTRLIAMKGSSIYGDLQQSVSEYVQSNDAGTIRKLWESEDSAMVTVACANCLMFVMLSRGNPKCPRCGISCQEQMEFPQPPFKRAKMGFSF